MNATLIIAGLTIKEAIRRRVFVASLLIALIFVLFAYLPIQLGRHMQDADPAIVRMQASLVLDWMGCGMIKFFSSILAVTLAAGSITAEVERGVLSIVVPKPLARVSVYLGKWLGLIAMLAASIALWSGLLVFAVYQQTGYYHAHIFTGLLAVCLFPLLFTTLTLFFSSFASYALSAGLALIAAGIALAEDFLILLSLFFHSPILMTVSHIVGLIVPLGKMNHWITRGLGDAGRDIFAMFGPAPVTAGAGDMIYILSYIVVFLVLGIVIFQRRDL